ncbi:hypothetical protein C8Q73DRAFT_125203 [Cubamyces lactineus]|nr:hypothetical protein C8Q73DRAFT_125203 [Cubamyces lactineus]
MHRHVSSLPPFCMADMSRLARTSPDDPGLVPLAQNHRNGVPRRATETDCGRALHQCCLAVLNLHDAIAAEIGRVSMTTSWTLRGSRTRHANVRQGSPNAPWRRREVCSSSRKCRAGVAHASRGRASNEHPQQVGRKDVWPPWDVQKRAERGGHIRFDVSQVCASPADA